MLKTFCTTPNCLGLPLPRYRNELLPKKRRHTLTIDGISPKHLVERQPNFAHSEQLQLAL